MNIIIAKQRAIALVTPTKIINCYVRRIPEFQNTPKQDLTIVYYGNIQ